MTSIFRELMAAETTLTSEYLAKVIQVTSRTVRNDIKELDSFLSKYGCKIVSIRGTGYELKIVNDQLFRVLLQEVFQNDRSSAIPTTHEERVMHLMKRFLLLEGYVKLEDLADELFISKSTIQNDLREVKKILDSFGIALEKRPNYGLKVQGDEVKLRFCISEYLFNRLETSKDTSHIHFISKEEMETIRTTILQHIKENNISLSDIGLNNIVIHIAIACKRIKDKNYVHFCPDELRELIKQKEYMVASKIIQNLEVSLEVIFPQVEIAYIAIHLLGTKMITQLNSLEPDLQNFIDKEIYQLTINVLEEMEKKLNLGIQDDKELILAMSLHLKPAINRFRYGMNMRNPMLDDIRTNYPIAFEAGIIASMVLKEELGIRINDDEIGYLAIHFGAAMERRKMRNQPKKCLVVCASGVGSACLLIYKLQSKFGSRLEIVGTIDYYKLSEQPLESIDFIISTISVSENLPIPVIKVHTFLEDGDLDRIENLLYRGSERSLNYISEDLVFLNQCFETREDVIIFLCDQLQKMGLVEENYVQSVLDREALSPTSFGNLIAIPHPISPKTNTTFWTICTLKNPIEWGEKKVQLVCLLNVQKNNSDDLQRMYKLLVKTVENFQIVQQLLKCKTYSELEKVFLK